MVVPPSPQLELGVRDTKIFNTSIDGNLAENGDSTPISSELIGQELSHNSSADIYSHCMVDFMSSSVGTEAPDFVHLGLLAVNSLDELSSFVTPATRFGRTVDVEIR